MIKITRNWYGLLKEEFDKQYFLDLQQKLNYEYANYTIYPPYEKIFTALNLLKYEDVKVVIIGQDPYHQPNQAMGMSFSVPDNIPLPPSLKNIFKEIESELNIKCLPSGDLSRWEKQGILLLNTVLTVRESQPNSHKPLGWETLTSKIIELLNMRKDPIIFVLWGGNAKAYEKLITSPQHYILKSAHPSPLSAYNGFFGNGHFKKINDILVNNGHEPINWE